MIGSRRQQEILRPVASMKPGQVTACSVSLLIAGVLFTHGFIGFNPGRPLFVVLAVALTVSATAGLVVDHVDVRSTPGRPADLLIAELNRSRRFGHPLSLVFIPCDERCGYLVTTRLRSCDRAWRDGGELRVLLIETSSAALPGFIHRIDHLVDISTIRTATFPDDALTAVELVRAMTPFVEEQQTPIVHPRPAIVPDLSPSETAVS